MSRYKEFIFFGIAGLIGYIVDVSVTVSLKPVAGVYFARIPAFVAAATATWLFNRTITFISHQSKHQSLIKEYIHYLSLMLLGLAVNYCVYIVSISLIRDMHYSIYISVGLGSLAGMIVNYMNAKRHIYSKPKD